MELYSISVGKSRLDTSWRQRFVSWEDLVARLSRTKRTAESCAEFKAMTKDARGKVKDIGGFVGGVLTEGHRKASAVQSRSLVTLDIDYGTTDCLRGIEETLGGYAWCLYSTHSHTELTPRYRLIVPLSREVTPEEYSPVARKIAQAVGIDLFDDSTYQPERLMYWPSTPADGEFVFREGKGGPANPDSILGTYMDWTNAAEWPVSSRIAQIAGGHGKSQEDPTKKDGVIGTFCRCYSISEAMDAFLPGVYEPTTEGRYTYTGGSTSNGVVSYEDKWIYSHHGTDPCGGKLCNAFDMVRLHLFGELDTDAEPSTPVNKLPSFVKMTEKAWSDGKCRIARVNEAFGGALQGNGPDEAEKAATASETGKNGGRTDDWKKDIEWVKKGGSTVIATTPANLRILLEHMPEFEGLLADDEFSSTRVILGDLPWRKRSSGIYWTDCDDLALCEYLNRAPLRILGKSTVVDAARLVSSFHAFHPVKDYLSKLPEWDGTPRVDTLLIDYLGAADTPLTRAVTRKTICAALKRIYHPGCKFDQVLTFIGAQGIGKSTFLANLMPVHSWFSDTPVRVDSAGSQTGLQVQGLWMIEMAELTDYKRSSSEAYKNFIAAREDRFRIPYDRSFIQKPRQFILTATTNDPYFLKGEEGNRRFWTVSCALGAKDVWRQLPAERDQIWAEALTFFEDEELRLTREMEEEMLESQACHNELADDIRVDAIISYMSQQVPTDWSAYTRQEREQYLRFGTLRPFGAVTTMARPWAGYEEIARECLSMRLDPYARKKIKALMSEAGMVCVDTRKDVAYGSQKRWALGPTTESDHKADHRRTTFSNGGTTETTETTLSGSASGSDNDLSYNDIW